MTRQPTGRRRMREHGSRKPQTCATIACMSTLAYALAVIAVAGVVFVFVATRREWKWTGFAGKSAWDWLGVLVIPVFLLLATVVLNAFQADREHAREDRDAARARALALMRSATRRCAATSGRCPRSYSTASWGLASTRPTRRSEDRRQTPVCYRLPGR